MLKKIKIQTAIEASKFNKKELFYNLNM